MGIVAPVAPEVMKWMLEQHGWSISGQDSFNWRMTNPASKEIVIVPKLGTILAIDVLDSILQRSEMTDKQYLETHARWTKEHAA